MGERAQTIGGFIGTVVRSDSDMVTLRTDKGVELDFIPYGHRAPLRPVAPHVPESDRRRPSDGR